MLRNRHQMFPQINPLKEKRLSGTSRALSHTHAPSVLQIALVRF